MNSNPIIENLKKTITLNDLKTLKSIVDSDDLKSWKTVYIGENVKDESRMFEILCFLIVQVLEEETNQILFEKDKELFFRRLFSDNAPQVVDFFDKLLERHSL